MLSLVITLWWVERVRVRRYSLEYFLIILEKERKVSIDAIK